MWSGGHLSKLLETSALTSELSSRSKYGSLRVVDTTELKQFSARERTEVARDAQYMLACGIVWRKSADPDAGWELVETLASPDPELRQFARDMLVQRRDSAMALLEDAVAAGILTPEVAGRCIMELLRAGRSGTSDFLVTNEA